MKAATCSRVIAESSVAQTLIRWCLNEVMARHDIRAKELAEEMGVSPTTVSNLRKRSMPRLTEETLNKLCRALNNLSHERTPITPGDLIEYTPEPENPSPKQQKGDTQVSATTEKLKQDTDSIEDFSSSQHYSTDFFLAVIPKAKEPDTGVQTGNFVVYIPDAEVA